MNEKYQAGLFDLDGVIVDTARYHFLAWRNLARKLGFDITETDNHRLKGVSRASALEIVIKIGGVTLSEDQKAELARQKNEEYLASVSRLDHTALLPGAESCLKDLREAGIKIALGSTSRNAAPILKSLGIDRLFDAVIDGNLVTNTKPDPEVFELGARAVGIPNDKCVVFEDAEVGLRAARSAGMLAVGIGRAENLQSADLVFPDLAAIDMRALFESARTHQLTG